MYVYNIYIFIYIVSIFLNRPLVGRIETIYGGFTARVDKIKCGYKC